MTDHGAGNPPNAMGQVVRKFSPDGKVLLTIGAGVAGNGHDTFNNPSDVFVAPNGDIYVADGHGPTTNARIVKFDKTGKYIKEWGGHGSGPDQLEGPHALAMDSRAGCSSATARIIGPDLRSGWKTPRFLETVWASKRDLHRPERHPLRHRFRVA